MLAHTSCAKLGRKMPICKYSLQNDFISSFRSGEATAELAAVILSPKEMSQTYLFPFCALKFFLALSDIRP